MDWAVSMTAIDFAVYVMCAIILSFWSVLAVGRTDRALFLYDTFEGMTQPDPAVDLDFSGNNEINDWAEVQRRGVRCSYSPVQEVRETMAQVGYPMGRVKLIKGPVEQTNSGTLTDKIARLRLDTDWCLSTDTRWNNCIRGFLRKAF